MAKQKLLYRASIIDKSGLETQVDVIATMWSAANTKTMKLAAKAKGWVKSLEQVGPAPVKSPTAE